MERENDSYNNSHWYSWFSRQRIDKSTRGFGNKRTNGDNPNYSIAKIGQNTEKSPGYLSKIAVTQTPVKDNQLTMM